MPLLIEARYPLGSYLGSDLGGDPEPYPSPARLHAAFLNAAGRGTTAEVTDAMTTPSPRAVVAVSWLEVHPPTAIEPPHHALAATSVTVYRREGLRDEGVYKQARAAYVRRSAIGSPVRWFWPDDVPAEVVDSLVELAEDIGYLGGADSPVVVEVRAEAPASLSKMLFRDQDADPFAPASGLDVICADAGRTRLLQQLHAAAVTTPPKNDAAAANEASVLPPRAGSNLRVEGYRAPQPEPSTSPWPWAELLVVGRADGRPVELSPDRRVAACVQLHRALIALIDRDGAVPPMVTGSYLPGVPRPANRLALQYITSAHPFGFEWDGAGAAFLVLGPKGCLPADWGAVSTALARLVASGWLRGTAGAMRVLERRSVSADLLWPAIRPHHRRFWVPDPLAIADTRPPRSLPGGRSWRINETAGLAVGLVWRDHFGFSGRGEQRYWALADQAVAEGVRVHRPRRVTGTDLRRYVHRMNDGARIDAYTAMLELPDFASSRAPVAIGQSRHLGGGMLVPVDLPAVAASQLVKS